MSYYQTQPKPYLWYIISKKSGQKVLISEGFETKDNARSFVLRYHGKSTVGDLLELNDLYDFVKLPTGY